MTWEYEMIDNDVKVYDWNGDHVGTATNDDPPGKDYSPDSDVPVDPDVRAVIREHLITDLNGNAAATQYQMQGLIYLAADKIEER